jgi:uncharacterized protein (TIGR02117 family)
MIRRGVLGLLKGIGGLLLVYLIATLLGGLIPTNQSWQPAETGVPAYLSSSAVHVNFVFPVKHAQLDWRSIFPLDHFPEADSSFAYIAISYGDLEFFYRTVTWADLTAGATAEALLWPTQPALHVEYLREVPNDLLAYQSLALTTTEYRRLIDFIRTTPDHSTPRPDPRGGYTPTDNFFPVPGYYHAFNTCNNWLNRGLKYAGIKTGAWSPLVWGITRWHRPRSR